MSVKSNAPLFILIDGHSLAFRAYYAFSKSRQGTLRNSQGIPTSICFGFLNSLLQVLESEKPEYLAVAFDLAEPTFRHQADSNYKADRAETPEDFIPDLHNLQQLLTAFNLTIVTQPGYEADDVLGTLATRASNEGYRVKIISGDRDLFQLVDDNRYVSVLYLSNSAFKSNFQSYAEFNRTAVIEKLKIAPEQVIDYKALCGDKSDNIPGVKGIGDKTAIKLLTEYATLEGVYDNLPKISGTLKQKLELGKEDAFHSRYLATIHLNTPLKLDLSNCKLEGFDRQLVIPLLKQLELKKIISNLNTFQEKLGGTNQLDKQEFKNILDADGNEQLSLFANPESIVITENKFIENSDRVFLIQPLIIDTEEKLHTLIEILEQHTDKNNPVAWDTETNSLEPDRSELIGIGCCWDNSKTAIAYIPIGHVTGKQLDKQLVFDTLKPILTSDLYPKTFQNTKFDRLVFHYQGIELAGVVFDTMLASYILNPDNSHNLTDLSERYQLDVIAKSYKELNIPKTKTIADLDIIDVGEYCGIDAYATYCLTIKLKQELQTVADLNKLLLEIELPLEPVLAEMETIGISLDTDYLQQFSRQLDRDLAEIEVEVYREAGEEFNLSSPQQLSVILFDKLGLNKKKTRKTKTGYSTDRTVLEKLKGERPIIDYILEHRTLAKLKSTYVDALPALVRPATKRLHTDFNQAITSTGRLSSSNPNLQNIPIRTEFSRQIRQAFIPRQDWLLVAADYSQIELRILAHLSQEPILLDAYRNSLDVHSVTARLLFDKEKVTSEERRLGKIINFGVIYGMGAQRFSRESNFSLDIGKQFIDKYRSQYSRVFAYLENVKREAISQGFVTTICGRRRYFNFTSESLQQLKGTTTNNIDLDSLQYNYYDAQLLRAAANAPIQGSSADIIKIAMVKLHEILKQCGRLECQSKPLTSRPYRSNLLLQVHDELVFEIPLDEWEILGKQIKLTMESAVELSIPLVVEVREGKNWMEAK
jgi:DNA polymerase-1